MRFWWVLVMLAAASTPACGKKPRTGGVGSAGRPAAGAAGRSTDGGSGRVGGGEGGHAGDVAGESGQAGTSGDTGATGGAEAGRGGSTGAGGRGGRGGIGGRAADGGAPAVGGGMAEGGAAATGGADTGGSRATGGSSGATGGGVSGSVGGSGAGTSGGGGTSASGGTAGIAGAAGGSVCDPATCKNGGTCEGGSICTCPNGFIGPDCGQSLCDPNPCKHGTCSAWGDEPSCTCDAGWEGKRCGVDVDECLTNNGGCDARSKCTNLPGGRACGSCPTGFVGTGESGCQPAPCVTAQDCDTAFGAVPGCTAWQCQSGVCAHASAPLDGDGDGFGAASACSSGPVDCDDDDASVGDRTGCYTGAPQTLGVGSCRAGTLRCHGPDGAGRCSGEVTPSPESCNGVDDDCNGLADDGLGDVSCGLGACRTTVPGCTNGAPTVCAPLAPLSTIDSCNDIDDDCDGAVDEDCADCVHVAPDGDDGAALASSGASAFGSVQAAVDFAAQSGAPRVCVAAGATCGASARYPGPAGPNLTMRDGVDLVANYESTRWRHCDDSTTVLAPDSDLGVVFPPGIEGPVRLDGFVIALKSAEPFRLLVGVTLNDARGVLLSNLEIHRDGTSWDIAGVHLFDGSDATIVRSTINAMGAPAVRSLGSRVSIQDSCSARDGGRCGTYNTISGTPFFSGCAISSNDGPAVLLEDSPGSRIEASGICASGEEDLQALLISGEATGTVVARSLILTPQGADYGTGAVTLEDCAGATPWFFHNPVIASDVSAYGDASTVIEALGNCRPVVDHNDLVYTGGRGATGVSCRGSDCVLSHNHVVAQPYRQVPGPSGGRLLGVECLGGCARADANTIDIATPRSFSSGSSSALVLDGTGAFVDRNELRPSCFGDDVGLTVRGAWSRIQNNDIHGSYFCEDGDPSRAPAVSIAAGLDGEVDFHSNRASSRFDPVRDVCNGTFTPNAAPTLELSGPPGSSFGSFRNNELVQTACNGTAVFYGVNGSFIFENNQLTGPRVLDDQRTGRELTTIDLVNALTGASGNRSDHVLIDTGTPTGAPTYDFDGNPRDSKPDIGAFEAP